ncbi:Flagellar L-ring protein precursor [Botrimarina colliarenosi]|uniref:Flagellar L-ring protein n=1 Tax=Botrimarina colliarenosi TaxID=2528001 RepID=A0A5C6AIS3_9BACT|nr:flagellar basal body L-ring protein FlgH [Botrimarina colliarenosi]TWT99367.1 Flagellar L-ring protein precursor [Botrimarina colliarenosi]
MKTVLTLLACFACGAAARGQEGSLAYSANVPPQGLAAPTLNNSSFIFQSLSPEAMQRPLEKESIITVLVDYRSVMQSEGSGESRRTGSYNAILSNWLKFDGKNISRAPQNGGDPQVSGTLNSQMRAESDVEQRESLTFPIAVRVVDIQPNGNLVIEGRSEIHINEEVWMTYISGTIPRQAIGPDLVVRDSVIADKRIRKYEKGAVRDGYSRGWLSQWYGKYKPW